MTDAVEAAYARAQEHDAATLNAVARTLQTHSGFLPLRRRYGLAVLVVEALGHPPGGKRPRTVETPAWLFYGLVVLAGLDLALRAFRAVAS